MKKMKNKYENHFICFVTFCFVCFCRSMLQADFSTNKKNNPLNRHSANQKNQRNSKPVVVEVMVVVAGRPRLDGRVC